MQPEMKKRNAESGEMTEKSIPKMMAKMMEIMTCQKAKKVFWAVDSRPLKKTSET